MKYEVRRAQLGDAEALEEYIQQIVDENLPMLYVKESAPSLDETTSFIKKYSNSDICLLVVAIEEGHIIGMLDATTHSNLQRSHCASFGMSVLNEYRRHGVGSALLTELLLWAKKHQLKRIELEVFSNNLAAIKLYERAGFQVEGVKKEAVRVDSGFVDILQMVKLVDYLNDLTMQRFK